MQERLLAPGSGPKVCSNPFFAKWNLGCDLLGLGEDLKTIFLCYQHLSVDGRTQGGSPLWKNLGLSQISKSENSWFL